ncbi:MbtH family protein [Salinispora arenicola]|uniref:MbtH protein n=1 Tax=Salinispora arenicola TaxID=168697 RepID=A0A542XTH6_SALAC|nr:MbtH family protein [Salinispora arenicola]MCN0152061.1 MbtH family protein [Salinispora arenicola]NIL40208.1 MbtH family protein [Salinispora arenicola]NIL64656.1 MbtH family protein [Salinispora arenicola]TQL39147.1 MbtH protein [Salinispora arenicola]GIM88053.1 protein mbtH [Salinispora arenicola]
MTNPFEASDADYTVLRNAQHQHSLWPAALAVPDGWTVVHGPADRTDCLEYVRRQWVDLRPSHVAEFVAAVSR